MWISVSNWANFWPESYFRKEAIQISCQVSAETNRNYSWQCWTIPWMQETSPKRVQNILPSQESEPLPRITKRKTDLVSPESWQHLAEPHLQKDCNPLPCPATSWGPQPEGYQLSSQDTKGDKQAIAVLGEKDWNNQWVHQNKIHQSLNLQRKGKCEISHFSLNQAARVQMWEKELW